MRILQVQFLHRTITGGGTQYPAEMARRLAARHRIAVASHLESFERDWLAGRATTLDAPRRDRVRVEGDVEVHLLTFGPVMRLLAFPVMLNSRLFALRPLAFRLGFGGKLRRLARDADLVHALALGRGLFEAEARAAAAQAGVPFVITPFIHQTADRHDPGILDLCREADAVVALTASEKDWLVSRGVQAAKVRVIPFGPLLPSQVVPGFLKKQCGADRPVVLFLGRKTRYKGLDLILAAAPRVWREKPETVFALAGPDTDFSRRLLAPVADPRIVVLPEIDQDEKASALADCAVFCVPSSEESLGGVYIEAMSLGKPVVALDIPPLGEVLGDGAAGRAVRADPEDLARALLELLDDPALAARLGARGREIVAERYSWERVVQATESLYQELLRSGPAA